MLVTCVEVRPDEDTSCSCWSLDQRRCRAVHFFKIFHLVCMAPKVVSVYTTTGLQALLMPLYILSLCYPCWFSLAPLKYLLSSISSLCAAVWELDLLLDFNCRSTSGVGLFAVSDITAVQLGRAFSALPPLIHDQTARVTFTVT